MGFDTIHDALQFVEQLAAGTDSLDTNTIGQQLRDLDVYLQQTLKPKGKNEEARKHIQAGRVSIAGQTETLSQADKNQTTLLSDTFQLDEHKCVRLLMMAGQQRGIASAAAAAAIYIEERRMQVSCLWYLLQSQILPEGVLEEDAVADWDDVQIQANQYTKKLLRDEQDGKRKLFSHLLQLVQEQQADPSQLPTIFDEQGSPVALSLCMASERTSICQCLVYACQVEPIVPEQGVVSLVKLLHGMATDFPGPNNQPVPEDKQAQFQQTYTVLVAFLTIILPPIITQGVDDVSSTDQEVALSTWPVAIRQEYRLAEQLAESKELKHLLEDEPQVPSGFHAVLKLAWGVMLHIVGADNNQTHDRAQQCMHAACEHGVLHFLHTTLLDSHCFQDEQPAQRQLYAAAFHRLLIQFLNAARSHEVPALLARCKEVESRAPQSQKRSDSLSTLLHCLASCYKLYPALWLNEDIKPDIVVPFMNYLADEGGVMESSSLLVAWLDLLTGMASGPKGASTVFGSLCVDTSGKSNPVSWMRMLLIMREYCQRYSQQPDEEQEQQPQRARQDCLVPPEDVAGLSAFLRLFSQVFRECEASQVEGWVSSLEEQSQIHPLWEVFFQLMCHPVPQVLKAACDEAIAVLVSRTGQASAMWERLLAAVVVQPNIPEDPSTGRYDISYQLAEIESRVEDYSETLALVRLLNALWKASGPSIYDGGRGYAHFSQFVLGSVLAPIGGRQHKSQKQKWDLFAACLQHLQLVIAALQPGMLPPQANSQSTPPPGLSVMLDMLRDGPTLKAVLHLVDEGMEHALEERSKPWGVAREGALLAALRVLVTALQTDGWLLQELRQHPKSGQYTETLDAVLKHDSRRISKLISCVAYTSSSAVQVEAIRLTHLLAARQPTLADMLVQQRARQGPHDRTGIALSATWTRLRFAFAGCLQSGLTHQGSDTLDREDPHSQQAQLGSALQTDTRAVLILELLLAGLAGPAPSLTHLLMGFDVTQGPDGVFGSHLDPQREFSCLAVVLELALTPSQPLEQPLLYEQGLQLLYSLAEHGQSREAMLTLLRQPSYSMLISQISTVLQADAPASDEPLVQLRDNSLPIKVSWRWMQELAQVKVARLHQRARLLQLAALELHCADLAVHDASCKHLLDALFMPFDTDSDSDEMSGDPDRYILYLLQLLSVSLVQQPEYVNELSSNNRQALRDMGVDAVLQSSLPVERGGVLTKTRRGQLCYDMSALTREMQSRYMQTSADHLRYSSEGSEGSDELREACRQGLRFAQKYNAWLEEAAALQALLQAWQQLVAVAITKRFGILREVAAASEGGGPASALKLLHELLSKTLCLLHDLLIKGQRSLLLPVAQVVEACMARLQEQALSTGLEGSTSLHFSTPGGQVPAATVDLFGRLLEALDRSQSEDALMPHLYAALLSFMQYSQGRRPAQTSPHILSALLNSGKGHGSSDRMVADMDDQNREVEEGIAGKLVQQLPLLTAVVRDAAAQTSKPALKAQALTLLASWVVAEPSLAVANQLHQQDLPNRILEDLVNRAHHFLPGPHAAMAVQVIEAQLTLLLRLSSARRSSSAEVTDELQLVGKLVHCKAIDLEPEEPVLRPNHRHDRRRHISRVLLLVLQVVNSEVATKQHSSSTMSQAVAFVAQHTRMMHRVLREAAVGNLNGWEPGEREAELATLVLSLVTRLSFGQLSQQPGAPADALRDGAHRLLGPFSCLTTESHSPLLRGPHTIEDGNTDLPSTSQTLPLKVARLRCALARYLLWEVYASKDFRYQIRHSSSMVHQPCLQQLAIMVKQAGLDHIATTDDRARLLDAIQSSSQSGGHQQLALQVVGANSKKPRTLSSLLTAAAQVERQLQQACLLAELLLAVLLQHFAETNGDPTALSRLGDNRAFATLQRLVGPTLDYFMNRTGSKSAGNEAVGQMARELKGYLSRAIQS